MNSREINPVEAMLALTHLEGVGNRTIVKLLAAFGSVEQVISSDRQALQAFGLKAPALKLLDEYLAQPSSSLLTAKVAVIMEQLVRDNIQVVLLSGPDYPPLLAEIPDPPALLYVKGRVELLHLPQLAIVGSRNASLGATQNAFNLAKALAQAGLAVTSGFALGVDKAAHEGALATNNGNEQTVAVLGTGVDRCYPTRNKDLLSKIVETGAVVSELPLGTGPLRHNFPSRNRIISGLSLGVLVIEAGLKSGSLITARMAMEQGREVFAIPGSIHHPLAKGCHHLIKQGAKLTENIDDILEELEGALQFHYAIFNQQSVSKTDVGTSLGPSLARAVKKLPNSAQAGHNDLQPDMFSLNDATSFLLGLIGSDIVSVDRLSSATGSPPSQILEQLFDLEMLGLVESVSGGYRRSA